MQLIFLWYVFFNKLNSDYFETVLLCEALAVLDLSLETRLASVL